MVDLDWKEYHDHDHEHEHGHEHDHEHEGYVEPKPLIFKVRPVL
jgi:ABC-type Zn2+ transport system substrate-binding protein/surface adhesin